MSQLYHKKVSGENIGKIKSVLNDSKLSNLARNCKKKIVLKSLKTHTFYEILQKNNLLVCSDHVANAFMSLVENGKTGNVMAVWVNSPPYYIPG